MRTQRFITIVCLLLWTVAHLHAYEKRDLLQKEADFEKVKSALIMEQKWVPYPDYSDRAGWDKLLGDYKEKYIRKGESYLDYEWKVVKATDYLEFGRSGDRAIMESPFGKNNSALGSLFMAEMAEGKGRFVDQIINGVFASCEMTSWALSAHLGLQKVGGCFPSYEEHVIDLGSGNLASQLSWIYYYLKPSFDKVNPLISKRLRHELQVRILDTYMNEDHFWWMAFNLKPGGLVNNWNPWCNFNVLQCFFLLENDRDKLAKAVYRTMTSVDHIINYTHGDGGCEEGPSYWGHAAGKMYDYLQMLSDGTGGKVSVFDQPIIKNMGEYIVRSYVGNGWVVNFADASAKGGGDADLIFKVYYVIDVNAFACADGSVRVFSSLMDIMTDEELLGVIGHEVGHVAHKDSKNGFRTALLTSALKDGISSQGGKAAALTDSQLGDLGEALVNATYSQKQERAADDYGYEFLKKAGKNPWAMALSFQKLKKLQEEAGAQKSSKLNQLFSTHPDLDARIQRMEERATSEGIEKPANTMEETAK